MAAIDFPAAPIVGDEFVAVGITYMFNGTGWVVKPADAGPAYVLKAGDTMGGTLSFGPAGAQNINIDGSVSALGSVSVLGLGGGANVAVYNAAGTSGGTMQWNEGQSSFDFFHGSALRLRIIPTETRGLDALAVYPTSPAGGNAALNLRGFGPTFLNLISGFNAETMRWAIAIGDGTAENGVGGGSNFSIHRYNDAGAYINTPFNIARDTGVVSMNGLTNNGVLTNNGQLTNNGDIYAIRAANQGYLFLGTGGTQYIGFDGSIINMMGAPVTVHSSLTAAGEIGTYSPEGLKIHGYNGTSPYWVNMVTGNPQWEGIGFQAHHIPAAWAGARISVGTGLPIAFDFRGDSQAYKPGGGAWIDNSDARIKNVLGDYTSGLAAVTALRPVRFTYKGNDTDEAPAHYARGITPPEDTPTPTGEPTVPYPNSFHVQAAVEATEFIGLVAQDAEVPMPELVTTTSGFVDGQPVTDLRNLNTGPLIFALINAVKELSARLEALEASPAR